MEPVTATLAGMQAAASLIQTLSANAKLKKYMSQRTAYKTPDEIYKILNLSLSAAGGDTITRDFQTNQLDRMFGDITGKATRLGADPNNLSALFEQKINGLLRIGDKFHASNMEATSKVLAAYDILSQNKVAEWRSREDILKDKIQKEALEKQAGIKGIGSSANAFISLVGAAGTSGLYGEAAAANEAEETARRAAGQ